MTGDNSTPSALGIRAMRQSLADEPPVDALPGRRLCLWSPIRGRSVSFGFELDLNAPSGEVWRRISELESFLTMDPFHRKVTLMRPEPGDGVDLILEHCVLGYRFLRFGRILRWREGAGYAFSDLSRRNGKSRGFPHVFFVHLNAMPGGGCRLRVIVRGKWTGPRFLAKPWLQFVCRRHARLVQKALDS